MRNAILAIGFGLLALHFGGMAIDAVKGLMQNNVVRLERIR